MCKEECDVLSERMMVGLKVKKCWWFGCFKIDVLIMIVRECFFWYVEFEC